MTEAAEGSRTYEEYINALNEEAEVLNLKILNTLQSQGPMNRDNLANLLDRPRTTVYDHLKKMLEQGRVKKFVRPRTTRGRPSVFWKFLSYETAENASITQRQADLL